MDQNEKKRLVPEAALQYVEPGTVIGVGTGSTANCFIDALAERRVGVEAAVASSVASAERLAARGVPVVELNDVDELAVYIDGADECTRHRALLKGGGGALTREKIVAEAARSFVCIVDDSKLVDILGRFPLPVEVIPIARSLAARRIAGLGGRPVWRRGFETDNGNVILDVHELSIVAPVELEGRLDHLPGAVCNGLFARRGADVLLVATEHGVDAL